MASLCYGKAGLLAICAVVTELKLIQWVTLHPTGYGISRLHLTIYNIRIYVFQSTYIENIIKRQLKEGPIFGWSVVCLPPTAFLGLIHSPVASRLDNRCPRHQFLIPPNFTLFVPVGILSDIAVYVGVPREDVLGEHGDVSDRLHVKVQQHNFASYDVWW